MKLDWQHVAILVVGLGCATACVILGKGDMVLQILAAVGSVAGAIGVFKASPVKEGDK